MTNPKRMRTPAFVLLLLTIACAEKKSPVDIEVDKHRGEFVFVELAFRNIGTPGVAASAFLGETVADLDAQHTELNGATFQLLSIGLVDRYLPVNQRGRFIHATFRVPALEERLRSNSARVITLVPIATAATLPGTPVHTLANPTGPIIDNGFISLIKVSGMPRLVQDGLLTIDSASILRAPRPAFTASLANAAGVTGVFAVGYRVNDDGTITFALTLPLLATRAENAATLSLLFGIVEHPPL